MTKRIKELGAKPWAVPALCAAVCLVLWLGGSTWGLASDLAAKAGGRLYPFSLGTDQFYTENILVEEDGTLVTITDDPQMIWANMDGRTVRTLRFTAKYSGSAREMCLYYTNGAQEAFSQDKRVFATQSNDGKSYLYTLPQGPISGLRLDPCSVAGNHIQVESIVLNEEVPLWKYFAPGWHRGFQMVLYTALAAAGLETLRRLVETLRPQKQEQKRHKPHIKKKKGGEKR